MAFADLKNANLDFNNLGAAPFLLKIILLILLLAVILGLGTYFHLRHQHADLQKVRVEETQLRKTFEKKYHQSANLELFKAQLEEMQRDFGSLLRQLPSKTEIPGLIVDISQTGLASGLEIELFKPQPDVRRDFYIEKPIDITVTGSYEEMARFASGIASLPRIVTLHNIQIKPAGKNDNNGELSMNVIAKTYRYIDDIEG